MPSQCVLEMRQVPVLMASIQDPDSFPSWFSKGLILPGGDKLLNIFGCWIKGAVCILSRVTAFSVGKMCS